MRGKCKRTLKFIALSSTRRICSDCGSLWAGYLLKAASCAILGVVGMCEVIDSLWEGALWDTPGRCDTGGDDEPSTGPYFEVSSKGPIGNSLTESLSSGDSIPGRYAFKTCASFCGPSLFRS